jgi:hypothetical protein
MATWPSYAVPLRDGYQEQHGPIADRGEMDRGVPKQRRVQSDVLVQVPIRVLFIAAGDADSFEDWYYGDAAAGAAYFDWTLPRSGVVVQARVVANSLGPVVPVGILRYISRTVTIEYLKALTL